ncbi:unannotated protein [freshwater metagenome]|uniref:Unannotated protein n=1 Tax=freshwater metagenome TaxID=449393 RepID=A0A6J7IUK1_9ZZZZ
MKEPLAQLSRARALVGAADVGVALLFRRELGAALGAVRGHYERALLTRARLDHRADDLRNHVAGLAQEHEVANEHALARYLRRVVQRGHLDGRPRYLHRLHVRERRDPPRATDADPDVEQPRAYDLGRVLVRDGPARRPRRGTQPALHRQIVDLEHHAIDLMLNVVPMLAVEVDELARAVEPVDHPCALGHRQPPPGQCRVGLALRRRLMALPHAHAVHHQAQPTDASQRPVEIGLSARCASRRTRRLHFLAAAVDSLAQRAGPGIARVRKLHQPQPALLGVERLELGQRQVHLTPHLHQRRNRVRRRAAGELLRDGRDERGIRGDIFPHPAVASRGHGAQAAILVHDVDRQAVNLQLTQQRR